MVDENDRESEGGIRAYNEMEKRMKEIEQGVQSESTTDRFSEPGSVAKSKPIDFRNHE
jgi:hypothetical protein